MSREQEAFGQVIRLLEQLNIRYMIGGSLASMAYGEPRLTMDMDVVAELSADQARQLASSLGPEWYADEQSMVEALRQRGHFSLIHPSSGTKVDFFVPRPSARSRSQSARRQRQFFDPPQQTWCASPEDVILHKLGYHLMGGSAKHLEDIRGILRVSGELLDLELIQREAQALGVADLWQQLLNEPKVG